MTTVDAIILGIVQGLTEFLPISSSGHLIIARNLFGMTADGGLAFDAVLQCATAFAIVLYFWRDLLALARGVFMREQSALTEVLYLVVATIPAVLLGLFLEHAMETTFRSVALVAGTLVAGSLIMAMIEWIVRTRASSQLTVPRALSIGVFQSLALVPGMSRSGMTISGGMLVGLTREAATRFAFLLGIPVLLGSGLKKIVDIAQGSDTAGPLGPLVVGGVVAFGVGLLVIHFLLRFLRTHTLMPFVWYRLALAALLLVSVV
ncbi:MAG: undecaprenyl-diphosphatase UppP [Candidatus Pacebacteria bacterium]|nr:undecaprenyl-diphosphatase UppP [Candidatus Paceibacterota bacterium]